MAVILTSFRVDEDVLAAFRIAVAKKHKGITRGTTFVELGAAISQWTKVMNGESYYTEYPKKPIPKAPRFGEEGGGPHGQD